MLVKRLVILLVLISAPAALAQSSAGALATARILRPLATVGLTTGGAGIELAVGGQRIHIAVAAENAELAVQIDASRETAITSTLGPALLMTRTYSPSPSRGPVSITIHNR